MNDRHDDLALLRRHDPASMVEPDPDSPEARATLHRAMSSTTPREPAPTRAGIPQSRRLVASLAVVAVGAAVLAFGVGLVPMDSNRAFAIRELPNGVLEISVAPEFRDGEALAAELREYGIVVDIEAVPASPSMVGKASVYSPAIGDHVPEGLTFGADGTPEVFEWELDPAVFDERLTIEMWVEAEPGEAYVASEEVFEPGEVLGGLHCALGEPLRPAAIVARLADLGLAAEWTVVHPTDDPLTTQSEAVTAPPEGTILSGYAVDDETIQFDVRPDGTTLASAWDPRLSDVPCTPEQAAGWS